MTEMSPEAIAKRYPNMKLDNEVIIEVLGEEICKMKADLERQIEGLEEQVSEMAQERRDFIRGMREADDALETSIDGLRRELGALGSELDILR
jgi:hypothetical protein